MSLTTAVVHVGERAPRAEAAQTDDSEEAETVGEEPLPEPPVLVDPTSPGSPLPPAEPWVPTFVEPVTAADAVVDLDDVRAQGRAAVGSSPVSVVATPPDEGVAVPDEGVAPDADKSRGTIHVRVVDEGAAARAGLEKVAFTVAPDAAALESSDRVRLSVDYASFRDAHGADWGGRLQLVVFSSCWLEAPGSSRCPGPVPVEGFVNDLASGQIYADVELGADAARFVEVGVGESHSFATGGPGYGLSAGAYSYNGNYATTSLNPSGEWSVGLNSGAFTWSYPVTGLAPPAGEAPTVQISYNSGAVDGLSSDQNTQGGLLGPGWSTGEAFIERSFTSCFNDGGGTGDLCWVGDQATISMDGLNGRLIKVGSPTTQGSYQVQTYRSEADKGWVITRWYRASPSSQGAFEVDALGEYWVIDDLDGNQYWFGFGSSTGSAGASPGTELHSVWTVPVRSLQSGEPCYSQTNKWCHQAYRWQLDRVVDANGRVTTYHHSVDKNHYGMLGAPANATPYVLGGVLERIEYGQLLASAGVANSEAGRMEVAYEYRCNAPGTCTSAPTPSSGSAFPDMPADQLCGLNGSASWCTKYAPTFFHTKRLTSVKNDRRYSTSFGWYQVVFFATEWVDADGSGSEPPKVWLRWIQRQELIGGTQDWYPTSLRLDSWQSVRENRSDYNLSLGVTPMRFYRLDGILDELGRDIRVTYSAKDSACPGSGGWNDNRRRCFPRWFAPPSGSAGFAIWNKYRVDAVEIRDANESSATTFIAYDYLEPSEDVTRGGMAWHADFAPSIAVTPEAQRSWGDYRGYERVTVITGEVGSSYRMSEEHVFYRGMNGDILSHSNPSLTKSVNVVDFWGAAETDHDWLAGRELDSRRTEFGQATDLGGTRFLYTNWSTAGSFGPASRTAYRVAVSEARTRADGGVRTKVAYVYDQPGRRAGVVEYGKVSSDFSTDVNATWGPDTRCTYTEYTPAGSGGRFPQGLPKTQTLLGAANCDLQTEWFSRTVWYYDGSSNPDAAPSYGNLTRTQRFAGDSTSVVSSAGAGSGVADVNTSTTFENNGYQSPPDWGRPTQTTDANGITTAIAYTSWSGTAPDTADNHNVKRITTTGPLGASVTHFDLWGRVERVVDVNGRAECVQYDDWSRITAVWLPGESTSDCSSLSAPTMSYSYHVQMLTSPAGSTWTGIQNLPRWYVRSNTLFSKPSDSFHPSSAGGTSLYLASYTYVDGLGRTLEVQTVSPAGGRIIERTRYDTRGFATRQSAPFYDAGAAGSGLRLKAIAYIPTDTATTFDAAGRVVRTETFSMGVKLRERFTRYSLGGNGYRIETSTLQAPTSSPNWAGSTVTEVDAYGNVVKRIEENGADDIAAEHWYSIRGERIRTRDDAGFDTVTAYNWFGWPTSVDDPDRGVWTTRYHRGGQVERTVDANGQVITRWIDAMGRPTAVRAGSSGSSPLLSTYTYDPSGNKGAVASALSYQPAGTLAVTSQAVSFNSASGRLEQYSVTVHGADDPAVSGDEALAATRTMGVTHTRNGEIASMTLPGVPGSAESSAEVLTYQYTTLGLLSRVASNRPGTDAYIAYSAYDNVARLVARQERGNGNGLDLSYGYSASDGRLTSFVAGVPAGTYAQHEVVDDTYTYDDAGNIVSVERDPDDVGSTPDELWTHDERECFFYDTRERLARAYTYGRPSSTGALPACSSGLTVSNYTTYGITPSGPAAYDQWWVIDDQQRFATTKDMPTTGTRQWGHDSLRCGSGAGVRVHAVSEVLVNGVPERGYAYDCNGSVTAMGVGSDYWAYTWTEQERLATTRRNADPVSRNVYDTQGQRVLRVDPDGVKTVYLGMTEIRWSPSSPAVLQVARHYPGGVVRGFDGVVTYTARNQQGSIVGSINTSGTLVRTRYVPYGMTRSGAAVADKAFLGRTNDPAQALTYLTHRSYDPATGIFTSVDPLVTETREPYVYAGGNPAARADPTGLCWGPDVRCDMQDAVKDVAVGTVRAPYDLVTSLDDIPGNIAERGFRLSRGDLSTWMELAWSPLTMTGLIEGPTGQVQSRVRMIREKGFAYSITHTASEAVLAYVSLRITSWRAGITATNTVDDAARFVADSAGNTTLRAQGPSGWINVTSHAAKRMTQRGISIADVDQALTRTPFNYWHNNTWKVGYYDPGTNVFVGTVNGVATTVITPAAGPQYIANLLAAAP